MKSDAHIFETADPIQQGTDLDALCGKKIKNAKFTEVPEANWQAGTSDMQTWKGICQKCSAFPWTRSRRYIVVSGI